MLRPSRSKWVPAFAGTTVGIQCLFHKRHWVPAEACPRVLESGAGTTEHVRGGSDGGIDQRNFLAMFAVIPTKAGIHVATVKVKMGPR
jgi:hypothetical protein